MHKKLVTALVVILVVLTLVAGATVGYIWYVESHVFVEDSAYPADASSLDLTAEEISFAHFDSLHAQMPECQVKWNVPFQGQKLINSIREITLENLTEEDIRILSRYFPELTTVHALDCSNYDMLEKLQAELPQLMLDYGVNLGGKSVAPDSVNLELVPEDYDFDTLKANLRHLPLVTDLKLRTPDLTLEQIGQLQESFPDVAITCTVELLDTEYDVETTELDLSAMTSEDVETVAGKLPMLQKLVSVELDDAEGVSRITKEEAKQLMEAAPEVAFHYSFDFYGQRISNADEEVIIKNQKIGDEGEAEVRLVLDLMQNCRRFVLDNCRISNDVMAKIREDYRDRTKVVWRIYYGEGTAMTDVEIIRSTYNVDDDNCHDLIYCEDVRYMDIGHNEYLDAIPFVAGMPKLEVVIVSGAPIKDLTPFENCGELKILEIANCMYITDLTPLAKCEKLEMLNISFTGVKDLTPLDDLKLTHLVAVTPSGKMPQEQRDHFSEKHPDCLTMYVGKQPYGQGWRYDENDDPLPWYADIQKVFRYPKAPNNVGWYLEEK